jgi:hypothetical protein
VSVGRIIQYAELRNNCTLAFLDISVSEYLLSCSRRPLPSYGRVNDPGRGPNSTVNPACLSPAPVLLPTSRPSRLASFAVQVSRAPSFSLLVPPLYLLQIKPPLFTVPASLSNALAFLYAVLPSSSIPIHHVQLHSTRVLLRPPPVDCLRVVQGLHHHPQDMPTGRHGF